MNPQKFLQAINTVETTIETVQLDQFEAIAVEVIGTISTKGMYLLNAAVACLEEKEIYCEIGCFQGRSLVAALSENPEVTAYAVDNFSGSNPFEENFDRLFENIFYFGLEEQVLFCNQDFESFFKELGALETEDRIGVYFYDGVSDYRSQLIGLLSVIPFLAERALIIAPGQPWSYGSQAIRDFQATHAQCELLYILKDGQKEYHVLGWNLSSLKDVRVPNFVKTLDEPDTETIEAKVIQNLKDLHIQERKTLVEDLQKAALEIYICKDFAKAEREFTKILYLHDQHAEAWHYLGLTYYMQDQYPAATRAILRALELEAHANSDMYYSLGLVLEKSHKIEQALNAYKKSIEINPKHMDAFNNLGNLFLNMGDVDRAEQVYRQAITAEPSHEGAYLNLGNILMRMQRLDEAILLYEKALKLNPLNPEDVCHNLRIACQQKGDFARAEYYLASQFNYQGMYKKAIAHYEASLAANILDPKVYLELARCYERLSKFDNAIATCKKGIQVYPSISGLYVFLLIMLQADGQLLEAMETAERAIKLLPDSWYIKFENQRILPILYQDVKEIEFYRARFSRELEHLIETIPLEELSVQKEALRGIQDKTTFYLNYQGKNDLPLQRKYGGLVSRTLELNYPHLCTPRSISSLTTTGKIRIGYISSHLRNHTVSKLFLGWLRHCDREQFEIHCYYTDPRVQLYTQKFAAYSDKFHRFSDSNLENICKQILEDDVHILVFLDVGMSPISTLIAGLRLAPVQCVAWGHPITTGLPTIDYFLTSDWMEPENGEEHYTETLIRLPKISISYPKPEIPSPSKTRTDFDLRKDAVAYLCCQSTFKYLPQFDYIFPAIAQQVPQAQFVFIGHSSNSPQGIFQQRLQKAFASYGLDWMDYCVLLPSQNQLDYWSLNCACDIFLDTFVWSGGNTTLEAIACELPIVTCPGEFMRGRHSYAILKMLRMMETIACTEAEYIDIAIRLGLDFEWRQQIVKKMKQNQHYLYDDRECVRGLEDFYRRVVREAL